MLVGEHGRVIPFRRFKEVAIAVLACIVLSLGAAIIFGGLYMHQATHINRLRASLDELQGQVNQLKDERDVLRAKLVIRDLSAEPESTQGNLKEATAGASEKTITSPMPSPSSSSSPPTTTTTTQTGPQVVLQKEPSETQSSVKWDVDIKQVEVKYDSQRDILKATFKMYNTSEPKEQISGRVVIAFKHLDDPPIKWLVIPNIPLKDGKPAFYAGQAFSVRNYQTMDFKAFKPPPSTSYDMMTVFILKANGELLSSRDFGIAIKTDPLPSALSIHPAPNVKPIPGGGTQEGQAVTPSEPVSQKESMVPAAKNSDQSQGASATGAKPATNEGETPKIQKIPAPTPPVPNVSNDRVKEPQTETEMRPNQEGKNQ